MKLQAFLDKHDTPLTVLFFIGLCILWFVVALRQEAEYPKLHQVGLRSWAVTCEGSGRRYRLYSENTSGYRSSASVIQRSLSVLDEAGEERYFTVRFDPDAYERNDVWSFRIGRDSRLFAPSGGTEILYGDEAQLLVLADYTALIVVTDSGGRLVLGCQPH